MPCPAHRLHISRIRTLYDSADELTRIHGQTWYANEHAYACLLSEIFGYSLKTTAACLAILSPRCQWPRVKAACELLLCGAMPSGIFGSNLRKAQSLLQCGKPAIHPRHAPKTWAFWQNLWHPDDPGPVTLDSWMFRAHSLPATSGVLAYDALADAYRIAARDLRLIPNQLQATVWLVAKSAAGHRQP